jgi:hypothetical protein
MEPRSLWALGIGEAIVRLNGGFAKGDKIMGKDMMVKCAHCSRRRNRALMKRAGSGWLCFDHMECQEAFEESEVIAALVAKGFDRGEVEAWMVRSLPAFGGLSLRQMILDGRGWAVTNQVELYNIEEDADGSDKEESDGME